MGLDVEHMIVGESGKRVLCGLHRKYTTLLTAVGGPWLSHCGGLLAEVVHCLQQLQRLFTEILDDFRPVGMCMYYRVIQTLRLLYPTLLVGSLMQSRHQSVVGCFKIGH